MNSSDDERVQSFVQALLKASVPRTGNLEPTRDLWPDMLHRLEARERRRLKFGALDWLITGLVAASVFVFPGVIPRLFYHL